MTRLKIGLILALLAALLVFGWVSTRSSLKAAQDRAEAAETALQTTTQVAGATASTAEGHTKRSAKLDRREEKEDARVKSALEDHRDWADQPIPADVLASLRNAGS